MLRGVAVLGLGIPVSGFAVVVGVRRVVVAMLLRQHRCLQQAWSCCAFYGKLDTSTVIQDTALLLQAFLLALCR